MTAGDIVTFDQDVTLLSNNVYTGRNFDDRIGTYCLLEAMRRVDKTSVDVYAVSSVQEEVGLRGMRVAAYAVEPDIGVAIDGSITKGPYTSEPKALCEMGEGTGVYITDKCTIGAPVRYMHSTVQLCHSDDIEATVKLLVVFMEHAHEIVEGDRHGDAQTPHDEAQEEKAHLPAPATGLEPVT